MKNVLLKSQIKISIVQQMVYIEFKFINKNYYIDHYSNFYNPIRINLYLRKFEVFFDDKIPTHLLALFLPEECLFFDRYIKKFLLQKQLIKKISVDKIKFLSVLPEL